MEDIKQSLRQSHKHLEESLKKRDEQVAGLIKRKEEKKVSLNILSGPKKIMKVSQVTHATNNMVVWMSSRLLPIVYKKILQISTYMSDIISNRFNVKAIIVTNQYIFIKGVNITFYSRAPSALLLSLEALLCIISREWQCHESVCLYTIFTVVCKVSVKNCFFMLVYNSFQHAFVAVLV